MALPRRGFAASAAVLLALGLPRAALAATSPAARASIFQELFPDPEAASRLADWIVGHRPELAGRAGRLLGELMERARSAGGELRHTIGCRVEEDFRTGRITIVDGWVLAEAEVLLCVAAARAGRVDC